MPIHLRALRSGRPFQGGKRKVVGSLYVETKGYDRIAQLVLPGQNKP
jgi:hypothetical protein